MKQKTALFLIVLFLAFFQITLVKAEGEPAGENEIRIRVLIQEGRDMDSLSLLYYDDLISPSLGQLQPCRLLKAAKRKDGEFSFSIKKVYRPGYFTISNSRTQTGGSPVPLLFVYLAEPRDNVNISIREKQPVAELDGKEAGARKTKKVSRHMIEFSGYGAAKYRYRRLCDLKGEHITPAPFNTEHLVFHEDNTYKRTLQLQTKLLENFRDSLSVVSAQILERDINLLYHTRLLKGLILSIQLQRTKKLPWGDREEILYKKFLDDISIDNASTAVLALSGYYPEFLVQRERLRAMMSNSQEDADLTSAFTALKDGLNQQVRDKTLTCFFLLYGSRIEASEQLIAEALQVMTNQDYRSELQNLNSTRGEGQKAYNFTLRDAADKEVTLSKYLGKVVFIDFWFTGCGACQSYYESVLADLEKRYESSDEIVFISICVDRDKIKWLQSLAGGKYSSSAAVNLYTGGLGAAHPVIQHYKIKGYPKPMIIDRHGLVYKYNGRDLRDRDQLEMLLKEALKK